jgi:ribosomal protein S19E (S16A)
MYLQIAKKIYVNGPSGGRAWRSVYGYRNDYGCRKERLPSKIQMVRSGVGERYKCLK